MKLDFSGIVQEDLRRFINDRYELDIVSTSFHPRGETSFSYIATGQDQAQHLIKVQQSERAAGQEAVLEAVHAIRSTRGLSQVVAALRSRLGTLTCDYGRYVVSVFPFEGGSTASEAGLSDEAVIQVANLLAAVHQCGESISVLALPEEGFDNPFEAPILNALNKVDALDRDANRFQRRLRELLLAEREDILAILETMRQLGRKARSYHACRVLTHGDPNLDNIVIDPYGGLHLVDWDDLALGPPERDLFAALGGRFERFLRHYSSAFADLRLHEDIFEFYVHRWIVQEIADYSTRILFRNTEETENEHAWRELTDYLPIRHHDTQTSVTKIRSALTEFRELNQRRA